MRIYIIFKLHSFEGDRIYRNSIFVSKFSILYATLSANIYIYIYSSCLHFHSNIRNGFNNIIVTSIFKIFKLHSFEGDGIYRNSLYV